MERFMRCLPCQVIVAAALVLALGWAADSDRNARREAECRRINGDFYDYACYVIVRRP